jgi:superfamily II DNA or RNA helicase
MVSEGFDLPKLDTLILATSKSDVEQSVGRIQRKHEYTDQDNIPLIVDIVDKLPLFERQAKRRQTFYNKMGYTCMKYNNDIH